MVGRRYPLPVKHPRLFALDVTLAAGLWAFGFLTGRLLERVLPAVADGRRY